MDLSVDEIIQQSKERISNLKKKCTRCLEVKTLSEFKNNPAGKNGKSSWCRLCHNDYNKNYQRNKNG